VGSEFVFAGIPLTGSKFISLYTSALQVAIIKSPASDMKAFLNATRLQIFASFFHNDKQTSVTTLITFLD
jgi:hypothetical protein